MKYKLIIFDFDGTLMDTKEPIVIAKQETMRQLGLEVADADTCAKTIGLSSKLGFKQVYPDLSEEMLDKCVVTYREIFEETITKVPPVLFPGVKDTLKAIKEKGIVCAIATSRNGKSLRDFVKMHGLDNIFELLVAAEDTKLLKPNPDPVLKVLEDLHFDKGDALVVGDMPYDILMGKGAGVHTCGVTYGNAAKEELLECEATYAVDCIKELLEIL